ncbi:hypothetical protein [Pengzhenrongella frigida]|uniref:Uncharacterized protein n=1 Tax=Pengzhenrongella frigida TaxID=1259133 RepID=A0A4Q5N5S0_9MICO|nr:hypothetical protein [Cellulomonas sp. HLT2-17]RYV51471.1 hypothetical protein EUA98_08580 [Cellulomonas sp. HLT2-17]
MAATEPLAYPSWNPGGELGLALQTAADALERNGLQPTGTHPLTGMTRHQRAALGALLGCGMVRPQVRLDLEVLDAIFRGKYHLAGGLVEACEIALGRPLVAV